MNGKYNIAIGFITMGTFMLYGFLLIYLRDFAPNAEEWVAIGGEAAALRDGLLENGNDPAQVEVISDLAPVRARLAGFTGAVFLKGSRRYQLETVLEPHAPGTH